MAMGDKMCTVYHNPLISEQFYGIEYIASLITGMPLIYLVNNKVQIA